MARRCREYQPENVKVSVHENQTACRCRIGRDGERWRAGRRSPTHHHGQPWSARGRTASHVPHTATSLRLALALPDLRYTGGKNNNKPVRRPSGPALGVDLEETTEKAFHSSAYEQERLNSLINAPERQTWEEFKETLRKKGEMDGDVSRAEEEAQRRFRQELDAARAERMGGGGSEGDSSRKRKKEKKEKRRKKSKREKDKKKRRRNDSEISDSESSDSRAQKSKKGKSSKQNGAAGAPVKLSSFFQADSSDSDS
eukprot:scaffold247861_cov41-Tisochrysis_lutea.AAC.1